MKAIEFLDGFGLDRVLVEDRPDPPPPGPGEALVRMTAASLNFRDLIVCLGAYGAGLKTPLIPFSDGCGVVEALGPGTSGLAVGDRVCTLFFQGWACGPPTPEKLATALGGPLAGCARELAVFPAAGLVKVPGGLSDLEAATLPCAALTAWRALFEDARLAPGDVVVLQGTGGVSIFGLQFAKAAGLTTVITSSAEDKLERALALGADHGINYALTPEWSREVRRLTNGRGADFVMEVGGAKTLNESLRAVRVGGHVAVVGVLSGPAETLSIPMMIGTSATLRGLSVGSREMFDAMARALQTHAIRPVIGKVFPFAAARAALDLMAAGGHFGKIVLEF
jgi:NADPH:quinone reductase-like Zn-dependent oxidoreductase